MVEVYSAPIQKRYFSSYFSFAYLFKVVYYVCMLVIPFLWAHSTRGFWKTNEIAYEQPLVEFTHKAIVQLESDVNSFIAWSTIPEYNELIGIDRLRSPNPMTVVQNDDNDDNMYDSFDIKMSFPLKASEGIHKISALLFFNFQLQYNTRMEMESAIVLEADSSMIGSAVHFTGDMVFHQKTALSARGIRDIYATSIIDPTKLDTIQDISFPTLLKNVTQRNETTSFDGYTHWVSGDFRTFDIYVHVEVPPVAIRYAPDAGEVLKFGLVQYFPFFAIVYLLFYLARDFVYSNQIFETRVRVDQSMRKTHEF